jgi:hypothetical protein
MELLPKMYGPDSIVAALKEWRGIRGSGFDLTTGDAPESDNGNLLVKGIPGPGGPGWLMRIDIDGVMQLALPARWHFLGYALEEAGASPRVNSLALAEIVLDFFRFLRNRLDPTGVWSGRVAAWTMKEAGVELHRGYHRREMWGFPAKPSVASGNDYQLPFTCPGPAERDAFECLLRLYGLWGFGKDAIPFVKDERIVPAEIIAAGKSA